MCCCVWVELNSELRLTDWSSLMGSWTLPVFCGTHGGSNMGTQGMPSIGDGRVKLMLGGGIYGDRCTELQLVRNVAKNK